METDGEREEVYAYDLGTICTMVVEGERMNTNSYYIDDWQDTVSDLEYILHIAALAIVLVGLGIGIGVLL